MALCIPPPPKKHVPLSFEGKTEARKVANEHLIQAEQDKGTSHFDLILTFFLIVKFSEKRVERKWIPLQKESIFLIKCFIQLLAKYQLQD